MSANSGYQLGMGFVPPIAISLANMTSNVPASALPAWAAGTSYALDVQVIDPGTGMIFKSLAAANQGNNPLTTPSKWQRSGVENRLRLCDSSMGSVTEHPDLIEIGITPGSVVTDLAIFGARAQAIQVLVNDPLDGLVFDSEDISMLRPSGNSHWGYFFTPIEYRDRVLISGLPAYTRAVITVRIKNPGATARCSELVLGRARWLGNARWRPSIGFDDWSEKKRDQWGGWEVTPGAWSDRMKLEVLVQGTQYERVKQQLVPYRAKPVVVVGAKGVDALMSYGYITAFDQVLVNHGISDCSMTIEGLEVTS